MISFFMKRGIRNCDSGTRLLLLELVFTVHFYFTQLAKGKLRISIRIGRVCPVVVVDYISTVCDTRYVCGIRDRGNGIVVVFKA